MRGGNTSLIPGKKFGRVERDLCFLLFYTKRKKCIRFFSRKAEAVPPVRTGGRARSQKKNEKRNDFLTKTLREKVAGKKQGPPSRRKGKKKERKGGRGSPEGGVASTACCRY